ncbi:histidine phosphatase family protein [bacterium]|nr:histidine phosphatase family protein [bacterium]
MEQNKAFFGAKSKLLEERGPHMSEQIVMGARNVYFMRHGRALANTDYENLSYNEFMEFLLKKKDPELCREQNEIIVPSKIDVIYPSPSLRARESAELIKNHLVNQPTIDYSLKELIDEVKFSDSIISELEFNERGGWKGCRELIAYSGENCHLFRLKPAIWSLRNFSWFQTAGVAVFSRNGV